MTWYRPLTGARSVTCRSFRDRHAGKAKIEGVVVTETCHGSSFRDTLHCEASGKGVTRLPLLWTSLPDKDLEQEIVTGRASLMQNIG